MERRDQSHDDDVPGAQGVSRDDLRRARERSGMRGVRPWTTRRRSIGLAQAITAKEKAEWLVQEQRKAEQIKLTPEEIIEDERYRR